MGIEFRNVASPPFHELNISAPDGSIIGVIGEKGSGESALLRLAGGTDQPLNGEVVWAGERRYFGPLDALHLSPANVIAIDHTLAYADALIQARAAVAIHRLRADGSTIFISSHEAHLLRQLCDEVWWFDGGRLAKRGDPSKVLDAYAAHIAKKFRAWGEGLSFPIAPSFRKGDGRAEIVCIETLGEAGQPTSALRSGEIATVRILVRYLDPVENPVIGLLLRTRIGLEVFGTNTGLEKVQVGPCAAGETVELRFTFRCELCPKEYTITAASHDPDGTPHEWLDDAVAFTVADSRYTAGVANLRARVEITKVKPGSSHE